MKRFLKINWVFILSRTFFAIGGISILLLLWVGTLRLLGYQLNKDFFTPFDKQQCIEKEYPTYQYHSGIAGCIFWARNDHLELTENWRSQFKKDPEYCTSKYNPDHKQLSLLFNDAWNDPKCSYDAFSHIKRQENWSYLTLKDKDQFYYSCVEQFCPNRPLFK